MISKVIERRERILAVLTDEFQSSAEIAKLLGVAIGPVCYDLLCMGAVVENRQVTDSRAHYRYEWRKVQRANAVNSNPRSTAKRSAQP